MTTSQTPFLYEVLNGQRIPSGKLAYFRARFSNRIHALVMSEFARLQELEGLTKAELARRIGRDPAQVTKWLGASGNLTAETISDLLLGMKCEPSISLASLVNATTVKQQHAGNNISEFRLPKLIATDTEEIIKHPALRTANG